MKKLDNQVAVITGGSSGIGLAAARRFHEEGARVVLFSRDRDALERARAAIGANVHVVAGDVRDSATLDRLFRETRASHGPVSVVFANAALVRLAPLAETTDALLDEVIATNLRGVFATLRAAIPVAADGASFIVTSSYLNRIGFPGSAAVAATKAAVRALVRVAAAELAARKIRVNAVCPGAIETPLWSKLGLPAETLDAAGRAITAQIPLQRWGSADEIASAVLFLASRDAAYVTGTELQVDGGLHQV